MARAPAFGRGKTRLAKDAGRVAALRINRALQARTLRLARDRRWKTILAVTPDSARAVHLSRVWPEDVARAAQGRGDLGARLARVMKPVRGAVAVIGTDSPDLRASDIEAAFRALGRARVSIGPARDGGFWILAARRSAEVTRAFPGVRWSSVHTLSDLVARLNVRHACIRTLDDIDTLADWRAWRQRCAARLAVCESSG